MRTFARPITIVTAVTVVVRLAAPPHFFLPVLYYPEWSLAQSRATIVFLFLSAVAAAICIGCAVIWLQRHRQDNSEEEIPFLERNISRTSGNRIVVAFAAIFGTLIFLWYFGLGLCSMSGGLTYPYFGVHIGDQAAVVQSASEFLIAHGARRTDEENADFRSERIRRAPQLASFEYPLYFGRIMRIAIFPDSDSHERVMIAFRCSGITARDMRKAGQFRERMRKDFLEQAAQIRNAHGAQ